ncbi:ketopantoate reductase family protein [Flagellimonas flava]|uniref:2-dehydropantoate 2-reductase n=1 Tax=Flagellimonas flava TaxID=570519 RepID=A0A1M5INU5_9FLAO|nr:2-dehydropantoate 2-reductase [Allomuricauda flava]SHG29911.1 2-dehydropantoate 2-reductase [Allomuricauda flava]
MAKVSVLVAGIGGVGGYFGGLLASRFQDGREVHVNFLARGEHLKEIIQSGLKVVQGGMELTAIPQMASDNPSQIGPVDYILLCTKSYDLEETVKQLEPCIHSKTVILPLLNGVNARQRTQKLVPKNLICEGCVYIISRLSRPGVVENLGNIQKLFFGVPNENDQRLEQLRLLFQQANIEATLTSDILKIIWEKFIFISAMATATSYFDEGLGPILSDPKKRDVLSSLISEISVVVRNKGIFVANTAKDDILHKLESLPAEATSSLHSDIQKKKKQTEVYSLVHYVVEEGKKLQLSVPVYSKISAELSSRMAL